MREGRCLKRKVEEVMEGDEGREIFKKESRRSNGGYEGREMFKKESRRSNGGG